MLGVHNTVERTDKVSWSCGRSYWQPLNRNVMPQALESGDACSYLFPFNKSEFFHETLSRG